MLSLYLFSLVVGGGLLLFSLLGSDADGSGSLHPDVDVHHVHLGGTMAHEFFSVRSLSYFLAGFGGVGLLLQSFTGASALTALLWALLTGLTAAGLAGMVYGWLRRSESGLVPMSNDHLVGLPAQVLLPVRHQGRGKVVAVHNGREVELLARLHGRTDPDCPRGATVVIVDIEGDTALVAPASFLPSET